MYYAGADPDFVSRGGMGSPLTLPIISYPLPFLFPSLPKVTIPCPNSITCVCFQYTLYTRDTVLIFNSV